MSLRKRGRGTRAKSARGEEWDELLDDAARARRRVRPSEQIDALRHLFDDPGLAGVDLAAAAVVINVTSARCRVFLDGRELDCIVPPEIAARQKSALAVGDRVLVDDGGVGKSSILNALDERLQIVTGDLHRRGTGRHTTTSSTLHDLGGGTLIVDTPGIRELGLWDLTPRALRESFPEFDEAAEL